MASELLISIDLGAQNTGVVLAEAAPPGFANSSGVLLRLATGQQQWSQVPRRGARHLSRCGRRRKLAKRLLRQIVLDKTAAIPPPAAKFINGLCNRRGFTYAAEEWAEQAEFAERNDTIVHELAADFFPADQKISKSLQKLFTNANVKTALAAPLFQHPLYGRGKKPKNGHAMQQEAESFLKKCEDEPRQKEIYNKVHKALEAMQENQSGHLPRADYLRNIRADIASENAAGGDFAAVLQRAGFSAPHFANIVGHVSNLPWRLLHNYFDDKAKTGTASTWDGRRLQKLLGKEVGGWHCDSGDSDEKARHTAYCAALAADNVLAVWARLDPEQTVPPFENRNNHNPPKCMSLLISTEQLNDDALRRVTAAFLAAELATENELGGQLNARKNSYLARVLQRVLDGSRAHDEYQLRDLASGRATEQQRQELSKFLTAAGAQIGDMEVFLQFAERYYDESAQGAHGTWAAGGDSVLRRCGINPPHKAKIKDALIARVLGCDRQDENLRGIEDFLRANKAGRKGLWAICQDAATLQKKYGNSMKSLRDSEPGDEDGKAVRKIYEHAESAAKKIGGNPVRKSKICHRNRGRQGNYFG